MSATRWRIPGMRMLAELHCDSCDREYFMDMPAGHGAQYPVMLDRATGSVDRPNLWFGKWLKDSYAARTQASVQIQVEELSRPKEVIVLNCLDGLYGHCLLKLLNAQFHLDHSPELGLVVLVPRFLRWLVPRGVAAIWTLDLPLSQGMLWNDDLATSIRDLVAQYDRCWLSVAHSHPHGRDFDIERFSGIAPFDLSKWDELLDQPQVTFAWRDDRLWPESRLRRLGRLGVRGERYARQSMPRLALERQRRSISLTAGLVRKAFPGLRFAVTGLGRHGTFPGWIKDLRHENVDDVTEREWCKQYAGSHVVIGIHGSNLLLPSAHAGAVVDIMPDDRWDNALQDLCVRSGEVRETLLRTRLLSKSVTPREVAVIVVSLLRNYTEMARNFAARE
jgi:hypothetical protein